MNTKINIISENLKSATCICNCSNIYNVKNKYDARRSSVGHLCDICKFSIVRMGDITQDKLLEAFEYNPSNGELRYKHDSISGKRGELATIKHSQGYLTVRINGKDYLAHRIVFFMSYGYFPVQVDHINHIRTDNSLNNLREVSNRDNQLNTSLSINSKTKINGVCLHKPTNKYRAYIMVDRKHIHLGLFNTVEEASLARNKADIDYGFHMNHGKNGLN